MTLAGAFLLALGTGAARADTTEEQPDDPNVVVACGNWSEAAPIGPSCPSLQTALDTVLQQNNAQVGAATIILMPGMYCPIDISAGGGTIYRTINLVGAGLSDYLDSSGPISFSGPEAGLSTFVSHNGGSQCSGTSTSFIHVGTNDWPSQHIMLRNLAVDGSGGTPSIGIASSSSNLWLRDVLVENVSDVGLEYTSGSYTSLSVQESSFIDNSTGVWLNGQGSINESTMADNSSTGLLATYGPANLGANTIVGNGKGIDAEGPTAAANMIVAGNTTNCTGNGWESTNGVGASGTNLLGTGCPVGASNGDIAADDATTAWLAGPNGALDNSSGPTPVIHPPAQAVGTGTYGWCLETDQRDVTNPPGGPCDIGSYNSAATASPTADFDSVDMGKIHTGDTGYGSATISADGGPIYLGDVSLTGPDAADFTIAGNSCTLAALVPHQGSGSCGVYLTTTETTVGTLNATLQIKAAASNASNGQISIPITAQIVPPAPDQLTVTRFDDPPGDGDCYGQAGDDCSLRQAVNDVAPGATIDLPAGTYQLDQGPLLIGQDVTLAGAGARTTTIEQTVNNGVVSNQATTTISGVTITGGSGESGGGIWNSATLTLRGDTITGNTAGDEAGGIYDGGSHLTVIDSTISGNTVTGDNGAGAGVFVEGDRHVAIRQSTIAGNTASGTGSQGGGIYADGGTVSITFATISTNAASDGGGIYSSWYDGCGCGAGVGADDTAVVSNTGGDGTNNCDAVQGRIESGGHNAVSDYSCPFASTGDLHGVSAKLGALGDSGGQTDTMVPGEGSPLIDAGSASDWGSLSADVSDADQRGTTRPQGSAVDIGAVEAPSTQVATSLTATAAAAQIDAGKSTTITGTLTDTAGAVSGASLQLESRPGNSGAFSAVKTAVTNAHGKATAPVKPTAKTQYRWTFAGDADDAAATSQPVPVGVAQVVHASAVATHVVRNKKITIYGTVTPNEHGQTVQLQRYAGGKWTNAGASATVHSQVLPGQHKAKLGYVLHTTEANAGTYKFRVYRAATAKNAPGHSATVTVTVTKN